MKEESGKDGRGVCLEWICASYLSGQCQTSDISQAPGSLWDETTTLSEIASSIGKLMGRARELTSDGYQALVPIVDQLDKRFPEAVVDVTVER